MNEFLAASYRRVAQQLKENAANEGSPGLRRDLEVQAVHFTLLAEAAEVSANPKVAKKS